MQFAVVGNHSESLFLIQAIQASGDHTIGSCCPDDELARLMTERGVPFKLVESAEEAILSPDTEAVIVASENSDESTAFCRLASQEDRHVVAILPDDVSSAFSYELHLLLDECSAGIIPFSGTWFGSGQLPAADSISELKMVIPGCSDVSAQRRLQLHAIDLVCGTGHQYTRITGLDVQGAEPGAVTRTVTLAASDASHAVPPATISFGRQALNDAMLEIGLSDHSTTSMETSLPHPLESGRSSESQLTDRVVTALTDRIHCQRLMEQFSGSLELLEGLDRSLRRRRTVDVYLDGVSERSVFKTQMTAIGCGILGYLSFGMIAYLVTAHVLDLPPVVLKIGRIIWFAPLILFLLAQLLLPFARKRSAPAEPETRSQKAP